MSDTTSGEGATVEIAPPLREFERARLLPGMYTDNGIEDAAVSLIRPDKRTISAKEMKLYSGPDGDLDTATAQFVARLMSLGIIKYISADCGADMMSVVLFLAAGRTNPGLILLNALHECAGKPIMNGIEIAYLAGIDDAARYPNEISPAAARLTYLMDDLLLEVANETLRLPPLPQER